MLLHVLILATVFSISAMALVLMCCAVGARADGAEEELSDVPAPADAVEAVVGEIALPASARARRPTLGL